MTRPGPPARGPSSTDRITVAGRAIVAAWLLLYAIAFVRPLRNDPALPARALALLGAGAEGRRSIVYGPELHRFLSFCKEKLPDAATYALAGIDRSSIDWPRAIYLLYPARPAAHPRFILVYRNRGLSVDGASLFAALDDESFILRTPDERAGSGMGSR